MKFQLLLAATLASLVTAAPVVGSPKTHFYSTAPLTAQCAQQLEPRDGDQAFELFKRDFPFDLPTDYSEKGLENYRNRIQKQAYNYAGNIVKAYGYEGRNSAACINYGIGC